MVPNGESFPTTVHRVERENNHVSSASTAKSMTTLGSSPCDARLIAASRRFESMMPHSDKMPFDEISEIRGCSRRSAQLILASIAPLLERERMDSGRMPRNASRRTY